MTAAAADRHTMPDSRVTESPRRRAAMGSGLDQASDAPTPAYAKT
ncbi:hypothetical protein [Streptomyces wuyuanensis]